MRLEGATTRRRDPGLEAAKKAIVTIKTVVHVVYKTDGAECFGRADQEPDRGVEQGFSRDESRTRPRRRQPWKGLVSDSRISSNS